MDEIVNNSDPDQFIHERDIISEMSDSYIDYSMSVIIGRSIPDVRDGLKPVHRRILYSMYISNFNYNQPHRKCARIVGDVLGKYHPHGDMAVYNALVRLAQEFSLRYPLIDGQGNFGSIDGDLPAAMRYTEARLEMISNELLNDLDKDTVDMRENFDGTLEEPIFLPAKIPNILMNGASGIAVGMATNIAPHNLREIGDAICAAIDMGVENFQPEHVYKHIKGPDFPTGGIIMGETGIKSAIETGRGSITIRAKTEIKKDAAGENRDAIIVTEIPYMVNKAELIKKIADLVNKGVFSEIADIRDESDRNGLQIYIEIKKNLDPNPCLNRLFLKTNLQTNYGIINLVLVDGIIPKILNYAEIIREFISHRAIVIRKRVEYKLRLAEKRFHILKGLLIAIRNIDEVVKLIKESENTQEARQKLEQRFSLDKFQTEEILKMPLSRLTNLQTQKLEEEKQSLQQNVTKYKKILSDKQEIYEILKKETKEVMDKFGDERRTEIRKSEEVIKLSYEEIIPEEECVILMTQNQMIKRMTLENYQAQGRGGRGKSAMKIKEEDFIDEMLIASSHDTVLLFTRMGRVFSIPAYNIPLTSRISQGKAVINYINVSKDELITDFVAISDFKEAKSLIFITRKGTVKKTNLEEFSNIRSSGIICMNISEGDELIRVKLCNPKDHIFIPTKNGYALHCEESEFRPLGRNAIGVRGIQLRKMDEVVDLVVTKPNMSILTITRQGYGKISELNLYRLTHRDGKGIINIKFHSKYDGVIACKAIESNEDILLASSNGILIRIHSKDIREIGRSTKGVIVMRQNEEAEIKSVALIPESEE